MNRPSEAQISDLLSNFPGSRQFTEQELLYIFIPNFNLPSGVAPSPIDVLLCPMEHAGYKSRLYFAQQVAGSREGRNWNGTAHVLGRSWHAFSWETPDGLSPLQMLATHVRALV